MFQNIFVVGHTSLLFQSLLEIEAEKGDDDLPTVQRWVIGETFNSSWLWFFCPVGLDTEIQDHG